MEKYCFSCMRKIPILAGRCPYCRENGQTVHGRMLIIIIIIAVIIFAVYRREGKDDNFVPERKNVEMEKLKSELSNELDKIEM